jgi:hypothetical protein
MRPKKRKKMQVLQKNALTAPSQGLQTVIGLDVGNSATKVVGTNWRDRQSSYVVEDVLRKFSDLPGSFTYVSGDRTDLINRSFFTGNAARVAAPGQGVSISEDHKGKVNFSLQMLIGTLGHRKHVDAADIRLVFSTANPADIEAQQVALEGTHMINYMGKVSTITVEVLKGLPEGYGALASQGLASGKSIVLDLGNGDIGVSVFALKGRLIDQARFDGGVRSLIQRISEHSVFSDYRHGGDRDLIRQSLENGSYSYGNTGLSFEVPYKAALQPWASLALKPALNFVRPHLDTADKAIAIGGGSLLPGVASALSRVRVAVAVDPVFASSAGMYALGVAKCG